MPVSPETDFFDPGNAPRPPRQVQSQPDAETGSVRSEAAAAPRRSRLTSALRGFLVVGVLLVVYVAATGWQVWDESNVDEADFAATIADAIVVLGAAQYDGRPSPVLEGRLLQALRLYQDGKAGIIVTTGANQEGDRFTEGFAGYDFLRASGVPESAILIDVTGTNTYEQLSSTSVILNDRGFESAILVSDPYHSYRLLQIADEVGLSARVSPTDLNSSFTDFARETAAVSVGRIIGFRRLSNLRG